MDLSLRLLAENAASGVFEDVSKSVKATASVIYDFAKESTKAFMEAERVQKQLSRAAGENADAFEALATQMSQQLAIEDEEIKKLQTLALSYGMLPQNVEGATRAVLDYAAATGRDANGAMQQLIRGVDAGNGTLGRMGITFTATGDKAKDLETAIAALNGKFGGAAAADADTLEGRARATEIAIGELKEAFGSLFALIESKVGILSGFSSQLQHLVDYGIWLAPVADQWREAGVSEAEIRKRLGAGGPAVKPGGDGELDLSLGKMKLTRDKGGGGKAKGSDAWQWGPFGNPEDSFEAWQESYRENGQKQLDEVVAQNLLLASRDDEARKRDEEERDKYEEKKLEMMRKGNMLEMEAMEKHQAEMDKQFEKSIQSWARAGDAMGAALVNAIGEHLLRLAEGGDVDPAELAGDVASTILTVVGGVVGAYFGAPQVGAALGALGGGLVKIGITSAAGKKHDGGWIERFHGGGWPMGGDEVPAILQTGERVLSRREVGAMGGARGVDAAARGRGPASVTINAIDSQSFLDTFGREGGRGLFNAIRVGKGDLVPLFTG